MNALDNPVWSSLTTVHQQFALERDGLVRYPRDVAPFLSMRETGPVAPAALEALVDDSEQAYMLGPRPELPAGWRLEGLGSIVQMVCYAPLVEPLGVQPSEARLVGAVGVGSSGVPSGARRIPCPPIAALVTDRERSLVLDLAALVYPHYFRPRTTELGRYHGILGTDRLDAMIGERMAMPGYREISAVCTHPECVGRGHARRLLAFASNDLLARGETPFLHVSPTNDRAVRLYEQNGYRRRTDVPFWSVRRS
jgi:ribosomal protein S18 acetylase RimI-like enzyme